MNTLGTILLVFLSTVQAQTLSDADSAAGISDVNGLNPADHPQAPALQVHAGSLPPGYEAQAEHGGCPGGNQDFKARNPGPAPDMSKLVFDVPMGCAYRLKFGASPDWLTVNDVYGFLKHNRSNDDMWLPCDVIGKAACGSRKVTVEIRSTPYTYCTFGVNLPSGLEGVRTRSLAQSHPLVNLFSSTISDETHGGWDVGYNVAGCKVGQQCFVRCGVAVSRTGPNQFVFETKARNGFQAYHLERGSAHPVDSVDADHSRVYGPTLRFWELAPPIARPAKLGDPLQVQW